VFVGGVLDDAHGAVGLVQAVDALHDIAVARLVLELAIARVRVLHLILELVLRVSLEVNTLIRIHPELQSFVGVKSKKEY
jgi:hypothetical protein